MNISCYSKTFHAVSSPARSQASISIDSSNSLHAFRTTLISTLLLFLFISDVNGFTKFPSAIASKQFANQFHSPKNIPKTRCFLKDSSYDKDVEDDKGIIKSVVKQLWFLPVLSLLSGLTPACRIISMSHISRLPDCPIAHDIDTRLLWPAIAASDSGLPPSVFRTPAGAITDEGLYKVDWALVWNAYFSRVGISMGISVTIILCVIYFLSKSGDDSASTTDADKKIV